MKSRQTNDFLWLQIKDLPYFRGLLRAVEARFYQEIPLQSPVLDLGCGDGHFASIAFGKPLDIGVDPWAKPLREAAQAGGYKYVLQSDGACLPFPNGYFSSVVSNSVLEHIPKLIPVINEVARVIQPGGLFLFCVPNHNFTENLSVSRLFARMGLNGISGMYKSWFNKISRHHHCDAPERWETRLTSSGFVIERYWHYFSPQALRTLEWGHYFGLPSLLTKYLFGKWILVPRKWNLSLIRYLIEPYYNEEKEQAMGSYTFYIARKQS